MQIYVGSKIRHVVCATRSSYGKKDSKNVWKYRTRSETLGHAQFARVRVREGVVVSVSQYGCECAVESPPAILWCLVCYSKLQTDRKFPRCKFLRSDQIYGCDCECCFKTSKRLYREYHSLFMHSPNYCLPKSTDKSDQPSN